MKKKALFQKFTKKMAISILAGALFLSGCSSAASTETDTGSTAGTQTETQAGLATQVTGQGQIGYVAVQGGSGTVTTLDVSDMFSDRDQKTEYEESECTVIALNGSSASCESNAVSISDGAVVIKEAGNYILRGSYNGTIQVEVAKEDKVQLILDNVSITSAGTAAIYVKSADKVFLTMAEDSSNTIINTGDFSVIDEETIDGAIYSKEDLTLNGNGTLTVNSEKGHGIVSKDDLKITGGTYVITAGDHGISGKDSIRILGGNLTITSAEDGLHSGNDEDADKGYVYIAGGNITINAGDDGIHGESKVVIADGIINIAKSYEGIEAAIVELAGGTVNVVSKDDGINATGGSGSEVYVLISGGIITVDANGDGLDANGELYVSGGEIYVNGPENNGNGALDYDAKAEITGGSIIALGSTGMAMNFSSSTQGSALITTSSTHKAGELVQLKDSGGNVLISLTSTKSFGSVVVSSPLMKQGETYTLTIGSETTEFTLDQLIYGQGGGFGGMGGRGGFGGNQMPGDGENFGGRQGRGGQMHEGQMPEGQMPESNGNFGGWPGKGGRMPEEGESFEGKPGMDGQMPGGQGGFGGRQGQKGNQGQRGNQSSTDDES